MPTSRLPNCAKLGVVGVTSADPSWSARPVQGAGEVVGPLFQGTPNPREALTGAHAWSCRNSPLPQAIAHPAASSEAPAARVGAR